MATPSSIFHAARTADNPFAWDVPDANGMFPPSPYDELAVLNWYTSIHYAVTISVGAILVPSMIYMVLFHTTGALLPYKKLLLVCSTSDFFFWLLDSCGQLKVRTIDGVLVGTVAGPAKLLPRWGQFIAASLGVTLVCFTNATLPAQSFYRYYALTRGKTCDKLKTTLILAFPFVVNIAPFALLSISFFESPKVQPGFNYGTVWFKEYPIPLLLILDSRSSWDRAFIATASLLISLGYLGTVYFSYRTWRQLCVYADKYSPKKGTASPVGSVPVLSGGDPADHIDCPGFPSCSKRTTSYRRRNCDNCFRHLGQLDPHSKLASNNHCYCALSSSAQGMAMSCVT
ncbi:unnamed protein product [Bursaphelenchus xylophilus]|uniref:(pine wood nematode) hypothetical protein n=1 Tax=Bursaphelenchus xylophilus TaxID=6326 RepID=A0A1I7RJQ9_BURXY|nr:unnamed protein product [Bursaphelenchus xylophilus]CAG9128994.1 unnamed protein product [Bursaphelenchus xylophilus]